MNIADLFGQALAQSLARAANTGTHCALCREGQGLGNKKNSSGEHWGHKAVPSASVAWSTWGTAVSTEMEDQAALAGESIPLHRCVNVTHPAVISITADHLAAAVSVHQSAIIHLFLIWLLWVIPGTAIRSLRNKIYNWLQSPRPLLLCYHHFQAH